MEKTRLRGDIVLDDRSYGGKITSRAAMFDEEDMGGSDDENNEGDLGDEDQMMMAGLSDRQRDSEDSEDGEGGYADPQNTVDEVAGNFEEEYYQLQQEEAQTVQLLKQHRDAQRKKGLAVQAQQRIWDGALEIRILLQRALQAANRLPRSKARDAIKKIDSNMFNGLQSVANVAAGALEDVLSLLCAIEKQNPALLEFSQQVLIKFGVVIGLGVPLFSDGRPFQGVVRRSLRHQFAMFRLHNTVDKLNEW